MKDILSTVAAFFLVWVVPVFAAWTIACAYNIAIVGFTGIGYGLALTWFWVIMFSVLAYYIEESIN